jgi:hypothetical protein
VWSCHGHAASVLVLQCGHVMDMLLFVLFFCPGSAVWSCHGHAASVLVLQCGHVMDIFLTVSSMLKACLHCALSVMLNLEAVKRWLVVAS